MDLLAVNRRDMSELLFHSSTYMIFSLLVGHFIRLCWIVTGACILRDVCLFSSSLGMPLPAVWSETVFDHRCGHTRAAWSISHWLCAVQTPITGVQEVVENLWAADSLGILVTIHWAHTLVTNQPIIRSCAILIARDLSILLNMRASWLTGKSGFTSAFCGLSGPPSQGRSWIGRWGSWNVQIITVTTLRRW